MARVTSNAMQMQQLVFFLIHLLVEPASFPSGTVMRLIFRFQRLATPKKKSASPHKPS